jgi:hypothetical protein
VIKPVTGQNGCLNKEYGDKTQQGYVDATTRAYMLYSLSFADNKDTKLFEEQFRSWKQK